MFDVITIGSATRDVFVRSSEIASVRSRKFTTGEGLCLPLGSKINIDELHFFVGGGAVNTAFTFAKHGFKVAVMASVGNDLRGREIKRVLDAADIDTTFMYIDPHELTAYSIILSVAGGERTILRYRGAVWHLNEAAIPWLSLETKWFYINHLGDRSAVLLPEILRHAQKHGIKLVFNPGRTQFEHKNELQSSLDKIDVFIVNQEEAAYLTGIPFEKTDKIFKQLDAWVKGIVIMTKGSHGVEVSDGQSHWHAGVLPLEKVVDRTGAGDAFGSGFVTALIEKPGNIEYAIQFASANATGTLTQWGATNGLIEKGESIFKYGNLKIKKEVVKTSP